MTQVWSRSAQKGAALLLLLAIADIARDDGEAYPSVATLALKIRMTERNTQRLIGALVRSGELVVKRGAGRNGTNLYLVMVQAALFDEGEKLSPDKLPGRPPASEGVTCRALEGDTASSPELKRTVKDPLEGRKRSLPEGFGISNSVREWARSKGWEKYLQLHFEHFLGHVKANGAKYINWDHALMNCVRADWGGVRRQANGGKIEPVKMPSLCATCKDSLEYRGWTSTEKGRVCNGCRQFYMNTGAYPTSEMIEQRNRERAARPRTTTDAGARA